MEFEAFERETRTKGQTSPVGTGSLCIGDFHLVGAAEVIAGSEIDGFGEQHVGTHGEMLDEALVPVVEP